MDGAKEMRVDQMIDEIGNEGIMGWAKGLKGGEWVN